MGKRIENQLCCCLDQESSLSSASSEHECEFCIDGTITSVLPLTFAGITAGTGENNIGECCTDFNGRLFLLPKAGIDPDWTNCEWIKNYGTLLLPCEYVRVRSVIADGPGATIGWGVEFLHREHGDTAIFELNIPYEVGDQIDCSVRRVLPNTTDPDSWCGFSAATAILFPNAGDLN